MCKIIKLIVIAGDRLGLEALLQPRGSANEKEYSLTVEAQVPPGKDDITALWEQTEREFGKEVKSLFQSSPLINLPMVTPETKNFLVTIGRASQVKVNNGSRLVPIDLSKPVDSLKMPGEELQTLRDALQRWVSAEQNTMDSFKSRGPYPSLD